MKFKNSDFIILFIVLPLVVCAQYVGAERSPPYPRDEEVNMQPIIGIVTMPFGDSPHNTSAIMQFYGSEFQRFGARIVPVFHAKPKTELYALLDKINGVFFTGGSLDLCDSQGNYHQYTKTAKLIWDYAKAKNDQDDYFPLWGTCQGFQLLHILASQNCDVLGKSHSTNHNAKLFFQHEALQSRLFRHAEKRILLANQNEALTFNMHQLGIPLTYYQKYPQLDQFFQILTTSYDQNEQLTVSTVQAKDYPFYGVQYHPERPPNDFNKDWKISHKMASLLYSQELARLFVHEARKSDHKMSLKEFEEKWNIWNFQIKYKLEKAMPYYDMGPYYSEQFILPNDQL